MQLEWFEVNSWLLGQVFFFSSRIWIFHFSNVKVRELREVLFYRKFYLITMPNLITYQQNGTLSYALTLITTNNWADRRVSVSPVPKPWSQRISDAYRNTIGHCHLSCLYGGCSSFETRLESDDRKFCRKKNHTKRKYYSMVNVPLFVLRTLVLQRLNFAHCCQV